MSKLKKVLLMGAAYVLVAALAIGGTIAYLSSNDSDVNVMTLGNVKIEQVEQERDANGNLVGFTQAKPAYPAVGPVEWAEEGVTVNGTEYKVFTDDLKNVIDKIVTVNNTGKSNAYVRTIVAIEAPDYDPDNLIHINYNDTGIVISNPITAEIKGVKYVVFAFTYNEALTAGEKSAPSLMQLFLDKDADNAFCEKFGSSWDVMVLSQAVQTAGFDNAGEALNTGFGELNEENVIKWFGGVEKKTHVVSSAQELKDAMLTRGGHIILNDDIIVDKDTPLQWGSYMFVANGREVTIDLNGHDIIVEEDVSTKLLFVFTTANNGAVLNVVGEGNVKALNKSTGVFWAMNPNNQINIYGGTYEVNGDNWSDDQPILYCNSGYIDVYGGKFYGDGHWISNVRDDQATKERIVFHEGTLLASKEFQQGDDNWIQLDYGTKLEETIINGETWYKVVAVTPVTSVAEVNAAMNTSDDIILTNCNDADANIEIPAEYTGTLIIENSMINSISAEGTANLIIKDDVVVKSTNGSAITGKKINISGNGNLTAIAQGDHAYGIGGDNTEKITINDVQIKEVKGGRAGEIGTDTKYYKDAPEGGAAIGSGFDGAIIELNNVHIEKAIGGSKSAGIGARYWTGVTVKITNSTIDYVEGGATAAAIGGSRVSQGATEKSTEINITNSTVTAKGGAYAAGIGSGYDTHCGKNQPLCTINITGSDITATGGQYAAGVGTGYHNAALSGKIKDSTINAVSGEKFYKDTYTQAQDIGFGVVDPAREGTQTSSNLTYNGTEIGIPSV